MEIRKANKNDLDAILELFRETVSNINKADYSDSQLEAWSSGAEDRDRWLKKIEVQYFLLAIDENKVIGFASILGGYLDTMFVHKDHQGEGIAKKLYSELEAFALESGVEEITTEGSITARPFFEKQGFKVINKQSVNRKGIEIVNFKMLKKLTKNLRLPF